MGTKGQSIESYVLLHACDPDDPVERFPIPGHQQGILQLEHLCGAGIDIGSDQLPKNYLSSCSKMRSVALESQFTAPVFLVTIFPSLDITNVVGIDAD